MTAEEEDVQARKVGADLAGCRSGAMLKMSTAQRNRHPHSEQESNPAWPRISIHGGCNYACYDIFNMYILELDSAVHGHLAQDDQGQGAVPRAESHDEQEANKIL